MNSSALALHHVEWVNHVELVISNAQRVLYIDSQYALAAPVAIGGNLNIRYPRLPLLQRFADAFLKGGDALGTSNYWFAAAVFAITLVISLVGLLFYKKICNRHEK